MSRVISSQSRSYLLEPLPEESIDEVYCRLVRILQHAPKDELTYQKLIHVSKLWYCKGRYHCHYMDELEKLIDSF